MGIPMSHMHRAQPPPRGLARAAATTLPFLTPSYTSTSLSPLSPHLSVNHHPAKAQQGPDIENGGVVFEPLLRGFL